MKCNVGGAEKGIRIVVGVGLAVGGYMAEADSTLKIVFYVLAGIAVLTALVGFCPLTSMMGINTCKDK